MSLYESQLSTVPTLFDNRMRPRHVDLRPFAVNDGSKVWVLPGGLTRVALTEGELIVNSSRGGGSKDTWVLAGHGRVPQRPDPERVEVVTTRQDVGPALESFSSQHDQQQQQQQQQSGGRAETTTREVPSC